MPKPVLPAPPVRRRTSKTLGAGTPLAIIFRKLHGGFRSYIEYVDLCARNGDKDMARYVAAYQALTPRDRNAHVPEQLCELVNIKPSDLVGKVCAVIWESKAAETSLISAIALPEVLDKTAQQAKTAKGYKDRELLLRATGSLPDKKGMTINYDQRQQTAIMSGQPIPAPRGLLGGGVELADMDTEVVSMSRLLAGPEDAAVVSVGVGVESTQEEDDEDEDEE